MTAPAALALACLVALAACSPREVADDVSRRTAGTVVNPVVSQYMPAPQAKAATTCIVEAASPDQLNLLLRDIGTRAGTDTVRNIKTIAASPQAAACLAAQGLAIPA